MSVDSDGFESDGMEGDERKWRPCFDEDDGDDAAGLSDQGDAAHQSDDGSERSEEAADWGAEEEDWQGDQDPLEADEVPENAIRPPEPKVLKNEADTFATLVRFCGKPVDEEKIQYRVGKTDTSASLKLIFVQRFEMDVEFYRGRDCKEVISDREIVHGLDGIFFELRAFYAYEGGATIEKLQGCNQHTMAVRTKILRLRDLLQAMEYEEKHAKKFVNLPDRKKDPKRKKLKPTAFGLQENFRSRCVSGEQKDSMPSIQAEVVQHFSFLFPEATIRKFFDSDDAYGRLIFGLMDKKNIEDDDMKLFDKARSLVY